MLDPIYVMSSGDVVDGIWLKGVYYPPIAGGAIDTPPTESGAPPAQDGTPPESAFGVPTEGDPLVNLGLIDPRTGQALATEDWQPEGAPGAAPRATAEQSPPSLDWDSPENPYKQKLEEFAGQAPAVQGRAYLDQKTAEITSQMAAAYAYLTQLRDAQGQPVYAPEIAQALVVQAGRAALAEARVEAEHIALLPQVKREAAERIAREWSTRGATVSPDELLGETTVAGMQARAKSLAELRRDSRTQQRAARGVDKAESGPPAGSKFDYSNLSPHQVIKLGLARGG
jgi:hypothetical protein